MTKEETKSSVVVPSATKTLGESFCIQIDHNYINGVSPMLDIQHVENKEKGDALGHFEDVDDQSQEIAQTDVIGWSEVNQL